MQGVHCLLIFSCWLLLYLINIDQLIVNFDWSRVSNIEGDIPLPKDVEGCFMIPSEEDLEEKDYKYKENNKNQPSNASQIF